MEVIKKISGKVIRGTQDGTKIGFPTANIETRDNLRGLTYGVYATKIIIGSKAYNSVTHFGPRYVFGEEHPQVEAYILDFNENIYDKNVDLEFIFKVRDSIKFDNLNELKRQIEKDVEDTRKILE